MNRSRLLLLFGAFVFGALPASYFLLHQWQENRIVDAYLEEIGLSEAPVNRATAVAVSRAVRRDFNVDETRFDAIQYGSRPFLREDTEFLLTHREGLCGEGTRVIANLLQRLDFDATRVTLYNRELESAHTLVSVSLDGREILVDSINAMPEVTQTLETHDLSTADFNVLSYNDNLAERRRMAGNLHGYDEATIDFFTKYWLYSYEALPYAKLLTTVGLDVRAFNFDRPSLWVSSLAEKPHLVHAILVAPVAPLLTIGIWQLANRRAFRQRKQRKALRYV